MAQGSEIIQLLRDMDAKVETNFRDLRMEISDLKDDICSVKDHIHERVNPIEKKLEKHDSYFGFTKSIVTWGAGAFSLSSVFAWFLSMFNSH